MEEEREEENDEQDEEERPEVMCGSVDTRTNMHVLGVRADW